ncbi:MAG: hypothetical protein PVH68_18915, partial [Armatimonadota bacterium]
MLRRDPVDRRIRELEREILGWVDEVWRTRDGAVFHLMPWELTEDEDDDRTADLEESLKRLRERWAEEELVPVAAEMLFSPTRWQHPYIRAEEKGRRISHREAVLRVAQQAWGRQTRGERKAELARCRRSAILTILTACLFRFAPAKLQECLEARIIHILKSPLGPSEWPKGHERSFPDIHLTPQLDWCLRLLVRLAPSPQSLDFMEDLLVGKHDYGPFELPDNVSVDGQEPRTRAF